MKFHQIKFAKNVKKKFRQKRERKTKFVKNKVFSQITQIWAKKINEFLEVKFGKAKLIIGAATWSAFGRFNQLVIYNLIKKINRFQLYVYCDMSQNTNNTSTPDLK